MDAALKLYQAGRYEEALELYTTCLDQLSSHDQTSRIATLFNRSLCHTKLKLLDKALEDYRRILELDGKNLRTNTKNIKTLCQLKRYHEAYEAALRWQALDPDCHQANGEVERLGVIVKALSQDQDDSDDDDAVTLIPDDRTPTGHRSLSSPVDDNTSATGHNGDAPAEAAMAAACVSPVQDSSIPQPSPTTFDGVTLPNDGSTDSYNCSYCDISFPTQAELKTHCRTDAHKEKIVSDGNRDWVFRDPPRGLTSEEYTKCPHNDEEEGCRLGVNCPQAHGDDELNEWRERFEYRKELLEKAKENELHGGTCAERVMEKWINSGLMPGNVLTESISGVKIYVNSNQKANMNTRRCCQAWLFTVTTRLHLFRVFLLNESNQQYFQISSITIGPKRSQKPQQLDEACQEWNNPACPIKSSKNETVYRVKILFRTDIFGTFRQVVVFDFGREPYLRQDLSVEANPVMDVEKMQEDFKAMEIGKWDASSKTVVPFDPPPFHPTPSDLELMKRYPMPTADQVAKFSCLEASITTQSNYKDRMHSLLAIEEMAQFSNISKCNLTTKMGVFDKYMLMPPTPFSMAKYAANGELYGRITLTKDVSEDTAFGRLILQNVNLALIGAHDKDKEPEKVYEAIVEDKGKNCIFLRLSATCVKELNLECGKDFTAEIQFQLNRVPLCDMHASIDKLIDPCILFPQMNVKRQLSDSQVELETRFGRGVNENQAEAIKAIVSEISPGAPIVLVGPYGTGKTFTLAQATFEIMKHNSQARVLICCHSNSSADLYIRDYFHAHPTDEGGWKPLRIVYEHRWMSTVDDLVRKYCLTEGDSHKRKFKYPDIFDLEKHQVVVTTCNTTRCLHDLKIPQGFFTHILLDEAAQALESELLIPLSLADKETRIVVAGDYMQMSPEVYSDYARQCDFHVSLLERLVDLYPSQYCCKVTLCENYRSDQAIIKFTSDVFYQSKLIPRANQMPHEKYYPLSFFTARGEDKQNQESAGFYNDAEVYEIVDRVMEIQKNWPKQWGTFDSQSIGVVAPSMEQVYRIRSELRNKKLSGVSVERVFNVQGKQFRVVVLSTVRTRHTCSQTQDDDTDYGFLSNIKVLNTALTRAQSLVCVVGDPISLCTIGKCRKIWEEYITVCHKNNSLYGIEWNQLRAHLDGLELRKTYVLNPLAPEFIPNRLHHNTLSSGYSNQCCNMLPPSFFNMPVRPTPGMIYLPPGLPTMLPQIPYNVQANMQMPWAYGSAMYSMPWMPRYVMGNSYVHPGACPPPQPQPPLPQSMAQPVQKPSSSPGRHRSLSGDSVFSQIPLQQHMQTQAIEKQRRPSVDGRYSQPHVENRQRPPAASITQPWQESPRNKRSSAHSNHQDMAIAGSPNFQRELYHYLVTKEGRDEAMRVIDHIVNDTDFAHTYEGRPLFKRNPVSRPDVVAKQGAPLVQPTAANSNGLVQKERNEHMAEFERRRHGSSSSIETRSHGHWNVDSSVWPRHVQKQQHQQYQLQQQQQSQRQQHQQQLQHSQQQQQTLRNPFSADFSKPPPKIHSMQAQMQSAYQPTPQKSKTLPQRTQPGPNSRYLDDQNRDWLYTNVLTAPATNIANEDSLVRFLTQSVESVNDSDSDPSGAITASSSQSSVFFSSEVEERILPTDPEPQREYNLFGSTPDRRRHMSAPQSFHSSGETPPAGYSDNLHDKKLPDSHWDRRSFGRNSLSELMQKTSSPQPIPSSHLDLELSSSFGENSFQNRPVADTPDKDMSDPLDLLRNLDIRPGNGSLFDYFS